MKLAPLLAAFLAACTLVTGDRNTVSNRIDTTADVEIDKPKKPAESLPAGERAP